MSARCKASLPPEPEKPVPETQPQSIRASRYYPPWQSPLAAVFQSRPAYTTALAVPLRAGEASGLLHPIETAQAARTHESIHPAGTPTLKSIDKVAGGVQLST